MHVTVRLALDVRLVPRRGLLVGEFGEVRPHRADHDVRAVLRERELFGEPVPRHHRVRVGVREPVRAAVAGPASLAAARAAPTFEDSSSITLTPRNDRAISAVRSRQPSAATVIETRAAHLAGRVEHPPQAAPDQLLLVAGGDDDTDPANGCRAHASPVRSATERPSLENTSSTKSFSKCIAMRSRPSSRIASCTVSPSSG